MSGRPAWVLRRGELATLLFVWSLAAWSTFTSAGEPHLPGEAALHDVAQRLEPALRAPAEVVTVVLVDDESLARLGERWPLDRKTWARFLEVVTPLAPTAVLVDAWFESPAPRAEADLALDLADLLRDGPLGEQDEAARLATALEKRAVSLDPDRRLAAAIAAAPPTVLGVSCVPPAADVANHAPPELRALDVARPAGSLRCARLSANHAGLALAAAGQAGLSVEPDADGVVRRYPYVFSHGDDVFPSMALAACRLRRGAEAGGRHCIEAALAADGARPGLHFRDLSAPRTVRFSDVVEAGADADEAAPTALAEAIRGRLVFVGVSAQGTLDRIRTPLGDDVPGVYLHAAAAAALLDGRLLRVDSPEARQLAWLGLGLLVLLGLATSRTESVPLLLAGGAATAAVYGALCLAAFRDGHWPAMVPTLGGLTLFTGVRVGFSLRRATDARRQARAIRHAFQHYVSPAVVETLVRDPDRLRLGGERRRITAFFSDIQGFTSIAEQMQPPELVGLLNEVLGTMTECLLSEGGNIDKYIGDAIVGMFGAPLDQPEHAAAACRGALRCQKALDEMRPALARRGLPEVHVRIGLNTGEALVGNMGSSRRFEYTMIGDAVNLAARLEGINSQYGTRILVGEETALAAGEGLVFRELDAVRPKGKKVPVRIFELVGLRDEVPAARLDELTRFARGLAAYRSQAFALAADLFAPLAEAGDPAAAVFLERTRAYLAAPPPETWDAVYTLTTK
ncbi:adenylate/guanylate cyclase domain-containing protein [Myxococcota bacterium]|nr:adenylate/guanylate cyclase domain-containing protein [Myxococcota bacterium]